MAHKSCRICSLDADTRRDIDNDLAALMPYAQIARKYAKQIARVEGNRYVSEHAKHVGKRPKGEPAPDPGTVGAMKEERHRKTVEERQDQIYDMAMMGAKLALYEEKPDPVTKKPKVRSGKERDIRGFAACLAQATAITGQMQASRSDGPAEQESDGYIEAVRATAKNDWQATRTIPLEAPKPEAAGGNELVAPGKRCL